MRTIAGKQVYESIEEVVAPSHTALLIIDMQNDLLHEDGAYGQWGNDISLCRAIVPNMMRLVAEARLAGVKVVYTMNTTLPKGASDSQAWLYFKNHARPGINREYTLDGSWGQQIIDDLASRPDEPVVKKHRSDAFISTDLELILRAAAVDTVVAAGIVTNGCVEGTIRHAAFIDFYTALVGDCCAANDPQQHEMTLAVLGSRHDVVSIDQICKIWEQHREASSTK